MTEKQWHADKATKQKAVIEMLCARHIDSAAVDSNVLPARTAANVGSAVKSEYTKEMMKSAKKAQKTM